MNPTFSVIIPVFNAEKHLAKTLLSVAQQTYNCYEVLLVDDGSTDHSVEICKEFSRKDNRFSLYRKTNGGVSSARNLGLQRAKGEYVIFVDSDDIVEAVLLEKTLADLKESNADMLLFGMSFDIEKQGKIVKRIEKKCEGKVFSVKELDKYYKQLYEENYIISMCNRVVRLSLIRDNGLKFNEKITNYEDMLFGLQCLFYAQSVQVVDRSY